MMTNHYSMHWPIEEKWLGSQRTGNLLMKQGMRQEPMVLFWKTMLAALPGEWFK